MRSILAVVVLFVMLLPARVAAPADRICPTCGEPVEGSYFETNGRYYHPDHFLCDHCERPIRGPYTSYKGSNYHTRCFEDHLALRCSLCGAVIQGEYIQDFWGHAYCRRHDGEAPMCDSCGRFISEQTTGGAKRYDDGRYVCNICRPTAVTEIGAIMTLVREVGKHMASFGMSVDDDGLEVRLIGREEMKRLSGHHSNGLRGFTDYAEDWRVLGKPGNRRMRVYLLYGMPRMELVSTIAHELAHVWQFNHGRFEGDSAWSEGSCNYAAYIVLGKYPGRESSFYRTGLGRDDDGAYGEGFRRVKRLAEREGVNTWLRHLSKRAAFPDGY